MAVRNTVAPRLPSTSTLVPIGAMRMSDAQTEYFETWLFYEIDLARRALNETWQRIDGHAQRDHLYRSGARIKKCVGAISENVLSLADKCFAKAREAGPVLQQLVKSGSAVTDYLGELNDRLPKVIEPTGHPSPRLSEAVAVLVDQIRNDLKKKIELSQLGFKAGSATAEINDFYNSGNHRIDAITAKLKGPQFIPKNSIKLRDALMQAGFAKVQNWSGQENGETNWYDVAGKETQALVRWREAVVWFRQELYAGNIVASRLEKNGTLLGLPKETFAQDAIEHIFREHQEQAWIIFVNASELDTLLSIPIAKVEKQSKKLESQNPPTIATKSELQAAYVERVKNWPANTASPTPESDLIFLKSLKPDTTRERMRDLRKAHAPDDWKRRGIRGKNG
jgi:hypothetical protein